MKRAGLFCLALAMTACGDGMMVADGGTDGGEPLIPVAVDTSAPSTVRAGAPLPVSCLLIDEAGETFTPPPELDRSLRFAPRDSVLRMEDGSYVATLAGRLEVGCSFPSLRLSDDTPAIVEVTPGHPARAVASLDFDSVEAGETARVTCDVFDAYGNRVTGAASTVRADPMDEGNTFEGTLGRFTRAGRFDVHCDVPGAVSVPAELEVRPGLPASLVLARVPDQPVYAIGQVIDIARIVTDEYGNEVPSADVPVTSDPVGQQLGDGRFRYLEDGVYTLTATVTPPTHDDVPLRESVTVIVDGSGPAISCDDPLDGAILDRAAGTLTFNGSVADLSGVTGVRVNGDSVPVDGSGAFSHTLDAHYGINFVDVAAVDSAGRETSRTCAFLLADTWAPDDRTTDDMLSLRMRQAAFDDANRGDPLDSLGDVLDTVLNSTGLRDQLHTSLVASNPLKPSGCDQRVFGVCVLRSEVIYLDSEINGPNTTTLNLVNGGLRANVTLRNVRVRVRVRGHVSGINYDTRGWVTFDSIDVRAIFDTSLSGGRPSMRVRPGSVSVTVGRISTDFSGLSGAIIDIVVGLFNGSIRDLVAGLVRDWVTDNFNEILDDVIGGLDISTLGTTFDVPRLDGGEDIPLSFGVGFSTLSTTASRMLFGIGTRFSAPAAHARPTLGAPSRPAPHILDAGGGGSTAVAVHETILNQALHALWRGGFFDATLDSASIGGVPEGVSAQLATGLPPVAMVEDSDRVELSLGAVALLLRYPELFSEPIFVTLGVRASMGARLAGEDLAFEDFRIEDLFFSTDLASLDMGTRDTLEGFLTRLLERVLRPALNDALPALPIPSFALPASLSAYGLPGGARLGIVSPSLAFEAPHFVLRGDFAVR